MSILSADTEMRRLYNQEFGNDSRDTTMKLHSYDEVVDKYARHIVFWNKHDPIIHQKAETVKESPYLSKKATICSQGRLVIQNRLKDHADLTIAVEKRVEYLEKKIA
jgi:hypothetical protein